MRDPATVSPNSTQCVAEKIMEVRLIRRVMLEVDPAP